MKIKILETGSKGNLYTIDNGKDKLLLEAGVPIKKINKHMDYKLNEISGCLVTHMHRDHCVSVPDLCERGIPVYAIQDVYDSLNYINFYANTIEPLKKFEIGSFTILPFEVYHDCPNVGFLISDGESKILFATDLYKCEYQFKGLTHIMIECNYNREILDENCKRGLIHPVYKNRVLKSHMELMQTQEFLNNNICNETKEVYLLHGSESNLGD